MKKVYILYNDDSHEIVAVSEDKSLIQEIMCDNFIEDLICETYFQTRNENLTPELAYKIWDSVGSWYDWAMIIFEEHVI